MSSEYWLASNSVFSFSTGCGSYTHHYTSDRTWNGKQFNMHGKTEYYGLILFNADEFDHFISTHFGKNKSSVSNKGRKKIADWEAFQIEAFKRLKKEKGGKLPKQDAFAEDMRTWFRDNFEEKTVPGLSTIKGRLKLIYEVFEEVDA